MLAAKNLVVVWALLGLALMASSCTPAEDSARPAIPAPSVEPSVEVEVTPTEPAPTEVTVPTVIPRVEPPPEQAVGAEGVTRLAEQVSSSFAFEYDSVTLGARLFPDDPAKASDLEACFDQQIRAAVGDENLERFGRDNGDDLSGEQIDAIFVAADESLLVCAGPGPVRDLAIKTEVDVWNQWLRPSVLPEIRPDDPCVQVLYPEDLEVFAEQWPTRFTRPAVQAPCLAEPAYKDLSEVIPPEAEETDSGQVLAGGRGLTLQWISWEPDEWGRIEFEPLGNEQYTVSGRQDGVDGDFVAIYGTMTRVSATELFFDGSIETLTSFINDGIVCQRFGGITFLATQDRQFWRMQDLLNCDGATTDYVDIYFG